MLKRILVRAGLVAFGVLAAIVLLLVADAVACRFVARPGENTVTHPRLNHVWRPNSRHVDDQWIANNPRFPDPYEHVYNSQSWIEDYDVTREKPERTFRIFYVGDSFTQGTCPMEQSVPGVVERELNAACGASGWRFEVVNTGTTSYSPLIYSVLVRHYIAPYDPDLIVINVDMTDDFDDWKYKSSVIVDDAGDPWAVPRHEVWWRLYVDTPQGTIEATLGKRLMLFLAEHSCLYSLVRGGAGAAAEDSPEKRAHLEQLARRNHPFYQRWSWCRDEWDDATEANVRYSLDVLEKLVRWCRGRGIGVLLTGVPHHLQMVFDASGKRVWSIRPHQEIEKVAERAAAQYLDSVGSLEPSMRDTPQTRFYYKGDMHFNPDGYALWAQAHVAALLDPARGLLPAAAYPAAGAPKPK